MLRFSSTVDRKDRKVNLVGTFGGQKYLPVIFKGAVKNKRKIKEKRELLRKICFRKIYLGFWCNS